MNGLGSMEQGETHPEIQEDGNHKLCPFVCGLCDCSYGQFLSFYKHFKKHSKEVDVGQDSFHICEDLPSSKRDVCEDQSESLEMQTFNCGICPASFITVCLLHEHMKKHEPKGSYTLDMQSNTGYPSSQQYPCVSLGNVNSRSQSIPDGISSDARFKPKRGRPSKHGSPGATGKRIGRPPKHVRPPDRFSELGIGHKLTRGKPLKCRPQREIIAQEKEVESRRHKSLRNGTVEDDSNLLCGEIQPKRGRPRKHEPSNNSTYITDSIVKSRPGRPQRSRHLTVKREKLDMIKSEPAENMNEALSKNSSDDRQDDVKVYIESAILEDNDMNDRNMETGEDSGNDDLEDGSYAADNDDGSDADFVHEDVDDTASASLNGETYGKENLLGESEETEESTYKLRRKQTSTQNVKSSARKNNEDTKKVLFCEVCGMKRSEHLLVKHVEQTHGGVELSKEFQETLRELKLAQQHSVKRKYVKKVKDPDYEPEPEETIRVRTKRKSVKKAKAQHKDTDFVPEDGLSSPSRNINNVTRVMVKVFHRDKPDYYAECRICGLAIMQGRITKHERYHSTPAGKRQFSPENLAKCDKCQRVLQKTQMSQHRCWHNVIKVVKEINAEKLDSKERQRRKNQELTPCHMCGNLVKRYLLRNHLLSHTEARPFPCRKCSKAFKTMNLLKNHEHHVHGDRTFQCDQCPWAFTTKTQLKDHFLQHTGVHRFSCATCGKQFQRSTQLRKHMFIHSEVANFACKECPKAFKTNQSLLRHVKIVHNKERYWICSWEGCAKTFSGSDKLKRHMIIHTGEKPEKCNLCDAAFVQREGLKVHMLQKHNTNEMPPQNPVLPFNDAVPQLMQVPGSGKDTDQPTAYKTIMFTNSTMSETDKKKLQFQLNLQLRAIKMGQKAVFTSQSNLDGGAHRVSTISDVKTEPETGDRSLDNKQDYMDVEATQEETEEVEEDYDGDTDVEVTQDEEEEEGEEEEEKEGEECDGETVTEPSLSDGQSVCNTSLVESQNIVSRYSEIRCSGTQLTTCNVSPRNKVSVTDSSNMPEISSLSNYRNTNSELRTSNTNAVSMQGASSLSNYRNNNSELRTSNTNSVSLQGASSLSNYRNTNSELRTSNTNYVSLQGASSLSNYRNTNSKLRTSNTNSVNMQGASNLPMYGTNSDFNIGNTSFRQREGGPASTMRGAGTLPLYSNTTLEPGEIREGLDLMQGSSNVSMPLMYGGVKAELDPGSIGVQSNLGVQSNSMSAGSLPSTMTSGIPYSDTDYRYKTF